MSVSRSSRLATVTKDDQAIAIAGVLVRGRRSGLAPEHFPDPTSRATFEAVMLHRVGENRDLCAVERIVRDGLSKRRLSPEEFETALEFTQLESRMREHELALNARHLIDAAEYRRLLSELGSARKNDDHELEAVLAGKLAALEKGEPIRGQVVLQRADEIEEKPLEWLWPGYIPAGMLTLLASLPKAGKSMLTTTIAARVSRGAHWPSGPQLPSQPASPAPRGDVLVITYEDDIERTVKPRLIASDADLSRVTFVRGIESPQAEDKTIRSIELSRHFDEIEATVRSLRPKLVIVDPVMSGFPSGHDTNADNEVRAVLGPFVRLAEESRAAFLIVTHTNKRTEGPMLDAVIGSRAFTGICRQILALVRFRPEASTGCEARDECDPGYRSALLDVGGNHGAPKPGLVFEIRSRDGNEARAYVEWIEEYHGGADEFRAELRRREREARSELREGRQIGCERAMREIVERERWIESKVLDSALGEAGHAKTAIGRARSDLSASKQIETRKYGSVWWTGVHGTEPGGARFVAASAERIEAVRRRPTPPETANG